jgi:hypothetical protein
MKQTINSVELDEYETRILEREDMEDYVEVLCREQVDFLEGLRRERNGEVETQ